MKWRGCGARSSRNLKKTHSMPRISQSEKAPVSALSNGGGLDKNRICSFKRYNLTKEAGDDMRFSVGIGKERGLKAKMDSLGIKETDLEEKFIRSSKPGGQR